MVSGVSAEDETFPLALPGPRHHAFPHLAVFCLPACGAAGFFRAPQNPAVAPVADDGVLLLLRLVESVLPLPGFVCHRARLLPGGLDGPLPPARAKGGCGWTADAPAL